MRHYTVKVTTDEGITSYCAIAECAADVVLMALEQFGECGVTVRPA